MNNFKKILPRKDFKYYEIYNASDFAIQDLNNSSDLLLLLDYGIFYEFIPMDTFGTPDQKVVRLADVSLFLKLRYSHHDQFWFMALSDW
jgi:hypothetical protein